MRATDETPSESQDEHATPPKGKAGSKRLGMRMADRAGVRRARGMSFRAAVTRMRRSS